MGNLSLRWGKPLETAANTECSARTHVRSAKGGESSPSPRGPRTISLLAG